MSLARDTVDDEKGQDKNPEIFLVNAHARAVSNADDEEVDERKREQAGVRQMPEPQTMQRVRPGEKFFRPTHIRIENLRTKTCRCLSNLPHRSFAGEHE